MIGSTFMSETGIGGEVLSIRPEKTVLSMQISVRR